MKTIARVLVELEISTREDCDVGIEAREIVDNVLDEGAFQTAIRERAAIKVEVISALVVGSRIVAVRS